MKQESTNGTYTANDLLSSAFLPLTCKRRRLQEEMLIGILSKHPEWFDAMRERTRELLQQREGGILDITLDELSVELIPQGQMAVPEELKQAFLAQIGSSMARVVNESNGR